MTKLFNGFQVMEGSDPVGCGFTSTPTSGKSFVSLKRTGHKHVPPLFEDEAKKYLDKMTWISCIQHSAVSSRRFFDLSLLVPNAPFAQKCCFFICDRLGIAVVYFVADHYVLEPFFPFIFESLASMAEHARNYLSALAVSLGMEEEAHWAHA